VGNPALAFVAWANRPGMDAKPGKLRALRKASGLNQTEAAAAADISRSHLAKVEAGDDPLSFEAAFKLAVAYKVDVAEVLPEGHPMRDVELVQDETERQVLGALRRLPEDERRTVLKMISRLEEASSRLAHN
jgi:transcriptional regulator with XRE-family HTH domain